jgi:phosphoadenosine phosphosulfate reductase
MSDLNDTETEKKRLDGGSLDEQSQKLDGLSTEEIIKWAANTFHKRIAVLSAFQKAGCVLCYQIYKLGLQDKVDVIFVDTGVNFQETIDTIERFRTEYGLNVVTLHPELTMEQQTEKEGVLYISKSGQEKCCALRKKVPLKKIKGKYEALLSSLHRAAGGRRKNVPVLALDVELNLVRVHPMVHMTTEEIEEYIKHEKVIYNPLHDQGYPTVSCTRCTTPVLSGEEERAGRWRHLENASQYCNINPTDRKDAGDNAAFVELRYETVEKILHYDI